MGLETGTHISDLVATNPLGSDQKTTADDHIRLLKFTLKSSFPNVNGAVNPTPTEFNYLVGVTSGIQAQITAKGAITGQTWTGTHTFPNTVSFGNVSATEISYLDGVTGAIQTQIDAKGAITGQAWTGTHNFTGATATATTQTVGDNSTKLATTAYADSARAIGDWVRLSTATASASATVAFTSLITSTYDVYMLEVLNAKPATNGALFYLQTSANNGSTYDNSAGNYLGVNTVMKAAGVTASSAGTGNMVLSDGISSSREGFSGFIFILTPSAVARCHIRSEGAYTDSAGTVETLSLTAAYRDSAAAVNAIRVLMSTGNITSGTFNLYGMRKT
jgi:hypothetical protein